MSTKIKLRRGDADEWVAADPILADGEAGVEIDTGKVKVGNGYSTWTGLPYFPSDIQHVQLATASITTPKLSPGLVLDGGGPPGSDIDPDDVPTTAGPSSARTYYVTSYGALGDGVTDDTTAIQAALDDAGAGARIYFPRGTYKISAPLYPRRQQILVGDYATKYEAGPWPFQAGTAIVADSATFAGSSVIYSNPNSYGVELSHLAIIGTGRDAVETVHGVYFGPHADSSGERAWKIKDCLINSCSGAGVAGHMWVFDMRDSHISNCGYGIWTFGDDGLLDARIIGCGIHFNLNGGIVLDGGWTGAIDIIGTRVERSGNWYTRPDAPLVPNAPGIRIRRGQQIALIGVNTDSNTGHGLHIGHPTEYVYNITVTGCAWTRDGGGSQLGYDTWKWDGNVQVPCAPEDPDAVKVSNEGYAGVYLENAQFVHISNTIFGYGAADDFTGDGPISPTYGFWAEDSIGWQLTSSRVETWLLSNSVRITGSNYRYKLDLPANQLATIPVAGEAIHLPTSGGIGSIAYQSDIRSIVVKNYEGDWMRSLWWEDGQHAVLPYQVRIRGENTDYKSLMFESVDDVSRWVITQQADGAGANLTVTRNNAAGAYQSTPLTLRASDGVMVTRRVLLEPQTNGLALAFYRANSETGAYVEYQRETGGALGGVDAAGKAWGPDATWEGHYVPLRQLKAVVAASTDFADFKTRIAAL